MDNTSTLFVINIFVLLFGNFFTILKFAQRIEKLGEKIALRVLKIIDINDQTNNELCKQWIQQITKTYLEEKYKVAPSLKEKLSQKLIDDIEQQSQKIIDDIEQQKDANNKQQIELTPFPKKCQIEYKDTQDNEVEIIYFQSQQKFSPKHKSIYFKNS